MDDVELELVFIAGKTSEARGAEEVLTGAGIDYCLDVEPFQRAGWFGPVSLNGVGFFVLPDNATACRDLLRGKGFVRGVVDPE